MKIISWNVNGIRACYKKGSFTEILKQNPDILCLQETKAHPDQLPDEVRSPKGYLSFFDHSKTRRGYSGVAIYSKVKPEKVVEGMGSKEMDQEGRLLTAYFKDFILINIYFPNGGGAPERHVYKLAFYDAFLKFVEKLRKIQPHIIFCGDINAAHTEIDLARPKENEDHIGFLPVERAWIDQVVLKGYTDVFRSLNPEKKDAYTYWDMKTFARDRNVGWRIDYFFASSEAMKNIKDIKILDTVFGSDHCPISIEISF